MRPYEPPTRDRSRHMIAVTVLFLAIPTVSLGLLGLNRGLRFGFHAGDVFLIIVGILMIITATLVLIKRLRRHS